jgi:ketosteroid isomerase-like protein
MRIAQEQNKQLIRQYFEAYDRQDTERIGQLLVSSTITHFTCQECRL